MRTIWEYLEYKYRRGLSFHDIRQDDQFIELTGEIDLVEFDIPF